MKINSTGIFRKSTLLTLLLVYLLVPVFAQSASTSPAAFHSFISAADQAFLPKVAGTPDHLPHTILKEMLCEVEELQEEEDSDHNHTPDIVAYDLSNLVEVQEASMYASCKYVHLSQRKKYLVFHCLRINC